MKTSFIYIYAIAFLLGMNGLKAQEMKPDLYWDFNSVPLEKPVWGESILHGKSLTSKSEDGIFGNYLHFNEKNAEAISAVVHFSESVTIECWLRFSSENFRPNTRLFWFQDNRIAINFINELLVFNSSIIGANGKRVKDFFSIELNQTGRSSLRYYLDNQWHHFVFKYDGIKGRKEVWVDGVLPEGFSNQSDQRGRICEDGGCNRGLMFSHSNDGLRNFMGDLDELMIYSSMIPEKLHIKHYLEGKQKASKPSFSDYKNVVKPTESISSLEIDPREYPPQHPQVRMSQMEQLTRFPKPRFKPAHQLRPLFNWIELPYLAGVNLPGATRVEVVKTSVELQRELAQNWNYMLVIQNANKAQHDEQLYEKNNYVRAWIDLANQHPEFPLGISTIWVQVNPRAIGINQRRPEVLNRSLNSDYYLKDRSGRFIDQNGRLSNRPHISFAAPDDFCYRDGLVQKYNISRILSQLSRPVYMINENGEAEPLPSSEKVITTDPTIAADMKKRGITDWEVYQAQQKTRFRKTYLSAYDGLKGLDKTIFSWYAVDGGPLNLNRFLWTEARKINTPINGQYYSTPDFYPRWPENWARWQGAWRGWNWLELCRQEEIRAGDRLFSPFIAAGWNKNPERNIRPSQWLGLVKHLGVIGAEFYYTGFFNEGIGEMEFPDPRNYIWQAAIPAYAQAITSHYEEILRNGNVLNDDKGVPIIRYPAGDPRILVTVRKHDQKPLYVIAANINPVTNFKGNVEDEKAVSINLEGKKLSFMARRQGSVYLLDLTDSNRPVFSQLDTWHENGHPLWWSKDFLFEAEVSDEAKHLEVITEKKSSDKFDFTEFETYVKPTRKKACFTEYFSLHSGHNGRGKLELYARSQSGNKASASVYIDDQFIGKLDCINQKSWAWASTSCNGNSLSFNLKNKDSHKLEIRFDDLDLEISQVRLKME